MCYVDVFVCVWEEGRCGGSVGMDCLCVWIFRVGVGGGGSWGVLRKLSGSRVCLLCLALSTPTCTAVHHTIQSCYRVKDTHMSTHRTHRHTDKQGTSSATVTATTTAFLTLPNILWSLYRWESCLKWVWNHCTSYAFCNKQPSITSKQTHCFSVQQFIDCLPYGKRRLLWITKIMKGC